MGEIISSLELQKPKMLTVDITTVSVGAKTEPYNSKNVLFFFGAGASAPFGIPTMKQFVSDFDCYLAKNVDKKEQELYIDIKKSLETKLNRAPDLEAIFSVIDGIINFDGFEKLNMFTLYFATQYRENFPSKGQIQIANSLKQKFQAFIKENCSIPESSFTNIGRIFKDFFNRVASESGGGYNTLLDFAFNYDWTIFTTNYDLILEYYWCEIVQAGLDTNFEWNDSRRMMIISPEKIFSERRDKIKLFKLHGSVNWQIEGRTKDVIETSEKGGSLMGRKYVGELMLYPIAEKQLYLEPFISMLARLNRELQRKNIWIVVGYSFNDPVIEEIFLKHCSEKKHLILVHPEAKLIVDKKFAGTKAKVSPVNEKFGLTPEQAVYGKNSKTFSEVNLQIMFNILGKEPSFRMPQDPTPFPY